MVTHVAQEFLDYIVTEMGKIGDIEEIPVTDLLSRETWEDSGPGSWTDLTTAPGGSVDPDNTSNPLVGSQDVKLTWTSPGSNPDTCVALLRDFTQQSEATDYCAARFAYRANTGYFHATGEPMEIVSIRSSDGTRGYLYLDRSFGGQYALQLQQVAPNVNTSTAYGIFQVGTTYYMEFRAYHNQSNGGLMLKVYSDASYTTEIATLGIDGTGGGWDSETLMETFVLGTIASADRGPYGSWQFDNVHIFEPSQLTFTGWAFPWKMSAFLGVRTPRNEGNLPNIAVSPGGTTQERDSAENDGAVFGAVCEVSLDCAFISDGFDIERLKQLEHDILYIFGNDPRLGGTCFNTEVTAIDTIINQDELPLVGLDVTVLVSYRFDQKDPSTLV